MKIKISKKQEKVLIVVISFLLTFFLKRLDFDYLKEVTLISYVGSSIILILVSIIILSRDEIKDIKLIRFRSLAIFLGFLIYQLFINKFVIVGLLANYLCIVSDILLFGYFNAKEEEAEKERRRLE